MTRPDVVDLREKPGARSARGATGFVTRTLRRFVDADGTSHVRALAYESTLIVLSGFIGVIGLASLLDAEWFRGVVVELSRTIAPGPAGRFSIQTGSPYGPLLSIVDLLIWSMLTSLALHLGLATACEIAAPRHRDRAGSRTPRVAAGTKSR